MSKVLVAMSGGVDSSVAAALLVEQGHEVTGVHLKLSDYAAPQQEGRVHGCCSVEAADDARRVAQVLDMPFYVWNLVEPFRAAVVDDFVGEYAAGRTPNPCVRCNERVKFGAVLERGLALGFDYVATGHYAVARRDGGRARLYRSADAAKDQSYVLSSIGRDALERSLFPVGPMTKDRTREIARDLSLRTADKPESFDICFVPGGDAGAFVDAAIGTRPGPIVTGDGAVVGEHGGTHRFTVGQRRGLGLATHERQFVVDIDAASNTIVVGSGELLSRRTIEAERIRWFDAPPASGAAVAVQIRAHGRVIPATLAAAGDEAAEVRLDELERGVAAGQTIAFYDGDEVLGGGIISSAR
ncbi:MAG TPA: tRNA 2-thiouridine(34) synthase MnmA [Actinomycetota bacterium]|nr:tRNA 2-thiouridine(34) synthase MnmA [Actinomycetota bacterium]